MEDNQVIRDIVYSQSGMQLDLYLPGEVTEPLPVIVWIHGGWWKEGDKNVVEQKGVSGNTRIQAIGRGYNVASINYRLSHEAVFPAQIHDCKAAIRWLRAHAAEYHINPERIGVWGVSAGGHLAALLGTSNNISELEGNEGNSQSSSSVQAVCDVYGPIDLLRLSETKGELEKESPQSLFIGGPIREKIDKVIQANPITYVNRNSPPFLIVHGDSDVVVPLNQSQIFYTALLKAKVEATLHIMPNVGHIFVGATEEQAKTIEHTIVDFFNKHLK